MDSRPIEEADSTRVVNYELPIKTKNEERGKSMKNIQKKFEEQQRIMSMPASIQRYFGTIPKEA